MEQDFDILKCRWRILMKRQDTDSTTSIAVLLHVLFYIIFVLLIAMITWNNYFIMSEIGIELEIISYNNDMRSYQYFMNIYYNIYTKINQIN